MPRIAVLRPGVDLIVAQMDPGEYWRPWDFCHVCYKVMVKHAGENDAVDCEHPPYSEEAYRCAMCQRPLEDWNG